MSATKLRWQFTQSMVRDAPDHSGVYVLWRGLEPLGVGHALGGHDTLRSRLLAHLSHASAAGVRDVTHYSWQIARDPLQLEAEVARELGLAGRRLASRTAGRHEPGDTGAAMEEQ
jgi:hypothetical protein